MINMKYKRLILLSSLLSTGAYAQPAAEAPVIVEETVIETTPASSPEVQIARDRLDAALANERLSSAPIVLPAAEPTVTETTTTTVEQPGMPTRVYSTERNVVIVEGRELPYLTIPVLFVEGTAKLLDDESRVALEVTAAAINNVLATDPNAIFDVEGHTSTDGSDEMNLNLSADRSRRIYTELVERYNVPTSALAAHGYGENYPSFPGGTEEQMTLDRRVLVVRVR